MSIHQPIRKALISVFDKTGLDTLGQALGNKGVEVFSTGGTADFLEKQGVKVIRVETVTGFPEMMDGRVKTLHPKVFGGILARRNNPSDCAQAEEFKVPLFDLVVVNLYPFWNYKGQSTDIQSANIDIGGPSMLRAASKNHVSVTVLSEPQDYRMFLEEFESSGGTTLELRKKLAGMTFARTSAYDAMIAMEWQSTALPQSLSLSPQIPLRYGENPHQRGVWAGEAQWKILQGKEISYNNLLDAEAASRIVSEFDEPSIAIIKHNNPCGVSSDETVLGAFERALECDSRSAFGGIVACNRLVDAAAAQKMASIFLEVVLAPGFDPAAREVFAAKKNLRLVEWPQPWKFNALDIRNALGGYLLQDVDSRSVPLQTDTVTRTPISSKQVWKDLSFAWLVCKHVRSNAIVIAKDRRTLGIGAGQMSRVDAVEIALEKAGTSATGAVLASDAFFPFRDNIDLLKDKGIVAVIQPGGSQRDGEVIAACDELGISMVFTAERHFRH